tara:strand:+ start:473 stop:1231 length:759 start_codon:yes stop_codon:yes gene_type:complete
MDGKAEQDKTIEEEAKAHAKSIRKTVAADLLASPIGDDEDPPLTIFMSGAPGAGKTEASREMTKEFNILIVDPDDFRPLFPEYTGGNSRLFQGGVSLIVSRVFDVLVKSRKSFLLDGTSANLGVVRSNIKRSLDKGREVRLWYVYQDPIASWEFVKAREEIEGRGIPLKAFLDQYFKSRLVASEVKREFGDVLSVDVLVKSFNETDTEFYENVGSVDDVCPQSRTYDDLLDALEPRSEHYDAHHGSEDRRSR